MIIIHGSRAFNYLDCNILKRESKDFDFLGSQKEFNIFVEQLNTSGKYKKVEIKPTSREDKVFIVCLSFTGKKLVVEYTFLDRDNVQKTFQSDLTLYNKGVVGKGKDVTSQVSKTFQITMNLEFKTLDLFCLIEEKLSHVTSNSKEKYKKDMERIESYIYLNNIDLTSIDKKFIGIKKQETINYQKAKKQKELDINKFFDEYQIKRYIKHDTLHIYIAKYFGTGKGTYLSLVEKNGFSIKESTFNNLTKEQQISLILEEIFVLTLERKIIPKYVVLREKYSHQVAIEKIDKVFKAKFFEMYIYYTLHLKGIPKYIKTYVKNNSGLLVSTSQSKISEYNIIKTLPSKLYDYVYNNYVNGRLVKNESI